MKCDLCKAPEPTHVIKANFGVINTGGVRALDGTAASALCEECAHEVVLGTSPALVVARAIQYGAGNQDDVEDLVRLVRLIANNWQALVRAYQDGAELTLRG